METSTDGVKMDATAFVHFKFRIGKRTVTQEREFDMEEFMKNPDEYGDTLRSAWFMARGVAAEAHRELGNVPPSPSH